MGKFPSNLGKGGAHLKHLAEYFDTIYDSIEGNPFGEVYYVHPVDGSDSNDGETPIGVGGKGPKQTLQAAIDLCNDWAGDVVIVGRGTHTLEEAVDFNVRGIGVITANLLAPFTNGERHMLFGTHDDGPAAVITEPCSIFGLGFCGSEVLGASLEIDCEEQGSWPGGFSRVSYCRFSTWGITRKYAINIKGTADNQIDNCLIDGCWESYSGAGIYVENSDALGVWNLGILDNRFLNIGSGKYCIEVKAASSLRQCVIMGNKNIGSAKFFKSNAANGDGLIADNYTGGATDTGSYDRTVDQLQAQGWDIANNHYSE